MTERTVHVELLDEGVEVWRPVTAAEEGHGVYRLPQTAPPEERWAFAPGSRVRCEERELSGEKVLVATRPA